MKLNFIIFVIFIFLDFTVLKEENKAKLINLLNLKEDFNICEQEEAQHLSEKELNEFKKLTKIDFSSFEIQNQIFNSVSMKVRETDTYEISCKDTLFALYDVEGQLLICSEEKANIFLFKDDIIYGQFIFFSFSDTFTVSIKQRNIKNNLPFDPINIIEESKFDKSSISYDPLKPAEVKYKKRTGNYLYINSNNPEVLDDSDLNKALIRLDISNKEVFFTFEHNTQKVTSSTIFSGFQVRNKGTDNIKVRIKNIGFQYKGKGNFLGQKEWIDFYNMKFKLLNKDKWNEKQIKRFNELINFGYDYEPSLFEAKTYIIPPGKYFYVIGGTTDDAYNNINVFNTANINIVKTVINGVVLFEVTGSAEGAYFIYDDINIPKTDTKSYQGYISKRSENIGSQYIGYDNCNGVIDNSMTWEFNDLTKEQYLPVYYKVYYSDTAPDKGQKPFSKISTTQHTINSNNWITHLNPHKFLSETSTNEKTKIRAVGTDMTKFITINEDGEDIIIDNEHYDGRGIHPNIGNWMIDYIDNFNFVNRGDKDRKVSVLIGHGRQGSIACFVRNSKLEVIKGTEQNTVYFPDSDLNSNDAIKDIFNYTFKVPPHSVVQIYVEYNLLANSYGNLTHSVYLGKHENSDNSIYSLSFPYFYIISLLTTLLLL